MSSFAVPCVWLLTMVVAIVLGARPIEGRRALLELLAAFAVTFGTLDFYAPPSGGVGFIAGLAAVSSLISSGSPRLDRVLSGVCAGAAAALYAACGLDRWLALLLTAGVMIVGLALIPRRGTARRDAILYTAGLLALAVGFVPDVVAGWRSARLMNGAVTPEHATVPMWAAAFLGISLLVGLCAGMWSRR